MRLNYNKDTDSLYIDLSKRTSVDSREIAEGVVVDMDDKGRIVGIDIDKASKLMPAASHLIPIGKCSHAKHNDYDAEGHDRCSI